MKPRLHGKGPELDISPARALRLGVIGCAMLFVAIGIGSPDPAGFGTVREDTAGEGVGREGPAASPVGAPAGLAQQLARLRAGLALTPRQEAAWTGFAQALLELDRVSRAFEARAGGDADAAGERMRHALLFTVALGEMDAVLTPRQSVVLREGARSLGGSFLCAQIGAQAGS